MPSFTGIFAIHILDGFVTLPWVVGGFVIAALLGLCAYGIDWTRSKFFHREIREEEIALIGVMTAAFYVASLLRIPVGPTTVHLLLNGLLGVVLRWRAALAIPVGLLFQALLFGHGGFSTLGINSVVLVLPALIAWGLFSGMNRLPFLRTPWFRGVLVGLSVFVWLACLVFSLLLIFTNNLLDLEEIQTSSAVPIFLHPALLVVLVLISLMAARLEPRLENAPEFPLGLLLGTLTVLLTMIPHCLVLVYGGGENWRAVAMMSFLIHLPVAAVEGIVLGFTVGFLARVKPSLLGWAVDHSMQETKKEPGDSNENGASPTLENQHETVTESNSTPAASSSNL